MCLCLCVCVCVCVCVYMYALQGQEFTEQYRLEFQRVTRGPWFHYRNRRGQEVSSSHCISFHFISSSVQLLFISRVLQSL